MTLETEQPQGLLACIKARMGAILHQKSETEAEKLKKKNNLLFDGDCIKLPEPQEGLHVVLPSQQDTAHVLTPEVEEKMSE